MLVLDTSIWIEIFLASDLGRKHLPLLSTPAEIIVPTIVQYEIFKWLAREQSAEQANRAITFTDECQVKELSTAIAILAAELSEEHKLHATDAIIYATAQLMDAKLFTCDAHFKGLPDVEYWPKPT
jgi:predicted nucleic acid-binding protein